MVDTSFQDSPAQNGFNVTPPPVYTFQDEGSNGEIALGTSNSVSHDVPLPVITPDDFVIAVMGVTGVGKSTFISHFNRAAIAGDSLTSCTINVGIHEARVGNRKCFLVDTPGFDDTTRSDTDILREVADWLNRSYQAKIKLAGIIYLHRIGDTRMTGAAMKNLRMFKKLCGDGGLSCVVLSTTMWSKSPTAKELQREQELIHQEEFWAGMIRKGSMVFRHDDGLASATQIIKFIVDRQQKITLKIQEEMANGKSLDETSAGQEVQAEMEKLKAKHEREMRKLREEMLEAQRDNDIKAQQEIAAVKAELEKKMKDEEEKRETLKVHIEELQRQRDNELHEERQRAFQEEVAHKEAMWRNEAEIQSLKAKSDYEAKLIEANFVNQMKEAELERYREEERRRKGKCVVM